MDGIMDSLGNLSTQIIFPAHPRTIKMLMKWGNVIPSNVQVIDPLSYIEMLGAMNYAEHVITDSGGVQKEAYLLRVPCTTIRNTTEWPETLQDGWNVISEPKDLVHNVMRKKPTVYVGNQFGSGNASTLIVDLLEAWYGTDRTTN
jgi:UDP-N-acetylglucosamine 2-epimerase